MDENEIDDSNPGLSKDPNFTSNSDEIIQQFNSKTKEIIKTMASLHFSTIDLRNKISQAHTNNNNPIITQVTSGNYQTRSRSRTSQSRDLPSCPVVLARN